jgi:hypothetical protein
MRKIVLSVAVAMAALPAIALASTSPAQSSAEKQCRQERTTMGKAAFNATYVSTKDKSNFGKCVSHRTAQNDADQSSAQSNAAKQCRTEQNDPSFTTSHNGETFDRYYGTAPKYKDAYGNCVSTKAKAQTSQSESSQVTAEDNAAKQCRTEQSSDPAAFKAKYGTNANKANAFGKCVSQKAHSMEQQSAS